MAFYELIDKEQYCDPWKAVQKLHIDPEALKKQREQEEAIR